MHTDSNSRFFLAYAVVVVGLGLLGIYLNSHGINLLLPIFVVQMIAQGLITYDGIKKERYDQYVLYMGFVVPFIAAMLVGWLNTF
jgi:hypothetical protein